MSHVHWGNLGLPESVLEQMLAAHSHMVNLVQPLEDVAEQRCISRHGRVKGCVKIHIFEAFKPWKVLISCFTRKVLWHIVDAHVLSVLCPTIAAYMFEEKYADMADIQWFIRITRVKNVLYIFAIPVPNGVGSDLLPAIYRHKGMILRLFLLGIRLSSWNSGCHLWDTLCGAAAGAFCKAMLGSKCCVP